MIETYETIFNTKLIRVYVARDIFDGFDFISVMTSFDCVVEVVGVSVSLGHPLEFSPLSPKNGLLSYKHFVVIVQCPRPSCMPIIELRSIFLFNLVDPTLNAVEFFVQMTQRHLLPPTKIKFSPRNGMHERVQRRGGGTYISPS